MNFDDGHHKEQSDVQESKLMIKYIPYLFSILPTGSSESELQKLQKKKLRAMDIRDTLERLEDSIGYVQENISLVAAKLAIQSLDSRS